MCTNATEFQSNLKIYQAQQTSKLNGAIFVSHITSDKVVRNIAQGDIILYSIYILILRQGKKISCHSNMKRFALIVDLVMRFNGAMVYYNELYSHKFINMI